MTIQTILGGFFWPAPVSEVNLAASGTILGACALDGAGKKVASVFQAPATGTLEKVYVLISGYSVTGNLDFRLETIDASTGAPTGTLVTGTTANALVSITGNGVFSATLSVSVTRGTSYALVYARSAGTYSAAHIGGAGRYRLGVGTTYLRYDGGSGYDNPGGQAASRLRMPIFGVKISGSHYPVIGAYAMSSLAYTGFNNTTATRERGSAITLPFPARVSGFFAVGLFGASDSDFILANTAGSALATFSFDKESMTSYYGAGSTYPHMLQGLFATPVDLVAGTTYYLTAKPTSASSITLVESSIINTADTDTMNCLNGGTRLKLVTRDSGGTYTVSDTSRPFAMGLIVSGFGDDAGGGGSTVYVGGATF